VLAACRSARSQSGAAHAHPVWRARRAVEAGYDTAAWVAGMAAAARVTGELAGAAPVVPPGSAVAHIGVVVIGSGLLAGLYRGRHVRGSPDEVLAVLTASTAAATCLTIAGPMFEPGLGAAPRTIMVGAVLAVLAMLAGRYAAFASRLRSRSPAPSAVKIIVFGAGEAGTQLIRRLAVQPGAAYRPVAVLDDDPRKQRLRIHGVPVLGDRADVGRVAAATGAQVLVIAIARASGPLIRELTAAAEGCGLVPKVIPSVRELLSGGARIDGVRDPRLGDLLGRRPLRIDAASVRDRLAGMRVLVTGAGGSIGSELCRQLHGLGGAELILLDRDESALHAVQLALHGRALLDSDEVALADIRDPARVRQVFDRYRPQVVFHAAAHKHLPLLERYPAEALKTNVWGTLTVLEAAADYGAELFVNISTDKAANPTSVLGYSKRIAERLTAHMSGRSGGEYLSVRFGNVLGSRGSVLTSFCAQVAAGGPVTVTDPEVSRYFMTADEAVQLVLQAAVLGRGAEVLVLDMGEPVRITEIAQRLIASTNRQIDVEFTGLRPGEKLSEQPLGRGESDHRPRHPLIRQVPVPPVEPGQVLFLDAEVSAGELRAALAVLAGDGGGTQLSTGGARHTVGGNALAMRLRRAPAQHRQPAHERVQDGGGLGVGARRPAHRVSHVVAGRVTEQARPLPALVDPRQPGGERFPRRPVACLLAPPDQLSQREGPRPCLRGGHYRVPDMLPGHAEHHVGGRQVSRADSVAAVCPQIRAVPGHRRDDLRRRRVAVPQRASRADLHRLDPPREAPGE
jgi:FlaA1/EpsC-like NDP-sugar epimerase